MKCNKCGAELKPRAKFCTICGEKVEVQRTCPNCGKPIKEGVKFCRECGAAVNTVDNTSINTEQVKYAAPAPVKSSKNKTAIGIIAAVIAVVVVIGIAGAAVLPKLFSSRSSGDLAMYVKDNSIYLVEGDNEPKELTDRFLGASGVDFLDVETDKFFSVRYYNHFVGNRLINYDDIKCMAKDGYYDDGNYVSAGNYGSDKEDDFVKLFYTDSVNGFVLFPQNVELSLFECAPTDGSSHWYEVEEITGYDLYYCKIGKKSEPVKIYSDVDRYEVTEDGRMVVFQCDNDLFTYDFSTDKVLRISVDVRLYEVTPENALIYYTTYDGKLYEAETVSDSLEAKTELISDECGYFRLSDDGEYIVYSSTSGNFVKYKGKPAEKLAMYYDSDYEYISDDYTVFYYVSENTLYRDTLGGSDEVIVDNVAEVLKIYDTGEVYYIELSDNSLALRDYVIDDMADADEQYREKYEDDYYDLTEENPEVCARFDLRRDIYEYDSGSKGTLCYYDGNAKTIISENVYGIPSCAAEKPVIAWQAFNPSADKMTLSEIVEKYSFKITLHDGGTGLSDTVYSNFVETYYAEQAEAHKIDVKSVDNLTVTGSGDAIFYREGVPNIVNYYGDMPGADLYRLSIGNGEQNTELYEYGVGDIYSAYGDSDILYFKNYWRGDDDAIGDLYLNHELLGEEIGELEMSVNDDGTISSDEWNEDAGEWAEKILFSPNEVHEEDDLPEKSFSLDGDRLYINDDGSRKLIDTGVSLLV